MMRFFRFLRRLPSSQIPVWLTAILFCSSADANPGAQNTTSVNLAGSAIARIESLIRQEINGRKIPGIAITIVKKGKPAWTQVQGLADVENGVPITTKTMFRFASVSKPITAVMTMRLAEQGKLVLNDSLSSIGLDVPEHFKNITIRQLLSHQSGLRHYRPQSSKEGLRHCSTMNQAVQLHADDPLLHAPGTRFTYTTFGYTVLGLAIEHLAEGSFAELLKAEVFVPSLMSSARPDHLYELIPNRAQGYFWSLNGELRNSEPHDVSEKIPGGGLSGTILDLGAFTAAILDHKLLSQKSLEAMWTEQKLLNGTVIEYGLGWYVDAANDEVYHGGSQPRVSSILYLKPKEQIGIAVLCNLEQVNLLPFVRRLLRESSN